MLKWTLRILIALVVLMGGCLFLVSMVSGTGESQKKGLEGAFSQVFQGTAQIGKVNSFNIMPQFNVDVTDLRVKTNKGGNITGDHIAAAFGLKDLFLKNNRIETLDIENLQVEKGVWSDKSLTITQAKIEKLGKAGEAQLNLVGKIQDSPLTATLSLEAYDTARPSFALRPSNPFEIRYGTIVTKGDLVPYKSDFKSFVGITIEGYNKTCSLGETMALEGDVFFTKLLMAQSAVHDGGSLDAYCANILKSLSAQTTP